MSESLVIGADGFALPLYAVTTSQAIIAMKRKGKSYTASVEAEEMLAAGQIVGVLDPTGAWWGIKSSPEGDLPGYGVVVFGGDHQDAPLDFTAGRAMAKAWVEHNFSAIWDLSTMDVDEQVQFAMDFCAELLRINRVARHLFIDEADTFAPQTPVGKFQSKCRAVVARLVKQGGKNGSGVTLITQRPQAIDKNALSQIDLLILLRISSPADAVEPVKWIRANVGEEWAARVTTEVSRLAIGEAFVFWPDYELTDRVKIRERRTFNSGRTVVPGETVIVPTVMAPVDMAKLGRQVTGSIQKAKEDSPEYLRERIRVLEGKLSETPLLVHAAETGSEERLAMQDLIEALQREAEQRREADAARDAELATAKAAQEILAHTWQRLDAIATMLNNAAEDLRALTESTGEPTMEADPVPIRIDPVIERVDRPRFTPLEDETPVVRGELNAPQQRIVDAIYLLRTTLGDRTTLELIAAHAGTLPRARGFEENMRQLKSRGLVDGWRLTPEGTSLANQAARRVTFAGVMELITKPLSTPQVNMLQLLRREDIGLEALASAMHTTVRARGFEENVRALKSRGYAVQSAGTLELADWLKSLR